MLFIIRASNFPFKATKQRKFKGKIYGFDIETYDDNKGFLCASIYYDDDNKWMFYNKRDLIRFLKTKRFQNSIISATNLGFDFMGVFHEQPEMKSFNLLFRGSSLVYAKTYIRNREFVRNANNKKTGMVGRRLCFLDTMNYASLSVEKLGNIIGVPKLKTPSFIGEKPKTFEQWEEMKKYNFQDSKVSKLFMEFLYNSFEDLGATPKLTIASTAMSLFKNKYLKDIYWKHDTESLTEQFKAYYGGRVEVFKRGVIGEHNYYDFNSLYPSVMMNEFPNPNSKRVTYANVLDYIKKYHGVSNVDIFCPKMKYPLLPYRINDKLIFPTGNFSGWYSHIELRRAVELGYTIKKVHKTIYFKENCIPFKEYVGDLYSLRNKYKQSNNPMEKVVKLLLNSLYGKFGQKFKDRDNWIPFNHTIEELNKLNSIERFGDYIRIKQDAEPSCFCFPIWALYVTAYGRIKLHSAMLEAHPVYVDTDSLITPYEMPVSDDLGDLKLEMKVSHGMIVKPKFYAVVDADNNEFVKIKGVAKKFNFLEFNGLLLNPEVRYKKFMKFKESIRRGFVPNEIIDMTKELSIEDNKRVWEFKFNPFNLQSSEPFEIIDGKIELHIIREVPKEKSINMSYVSELTE